MYKLRKRLLIVNLVINIALVFIMSQISNLLYRYNRMIVWTERSEYYNQFYVNMQDKLIMVWIILGVLILLSIIHLYIEFRKGIKST